MAAALGLRCPAEPNRDNANEALRSAHRTPLAAGACSNFRPGSSQGLRYNRRRPRCFEAAVSELERAVKEIAEEMRQRSDRGEVATYIPELACVDPAAFGITVVDAGGNVAAAGDSDTPFSIQSISKVFTL